MKFLLDSIRAHPPNEGLAGQLVCFLLIEDYGIGTPCQKKERKGKDQKEGNELDLPCGKGVWDTGNGGGGQWEYIQGIGMEGNKGGGKKMKIEKNESKMK